MIDMGQGPPECYARLETVFPKGEDGLRHTPESCMACDYKTGCLRNAMAGARGLKARAEYVDRAYDAGLIGFFSRWSKRKDIHRKLSEEQKEKKGRGVG